MTSSIEQETGTGTSRLVLVEISGEFKKNLSSNSRVSWSRLSDSVEWYGEVPFQVDIENGIVKRVFLREAIKNRDQFQEGAHSLFGD